MKHPHADRMFEYAEDALETEEPWRRWQFKNDGFDWVDCVEQPGWYIQCEYRRKPKQNEIDTEAFNEWYNSTPSNAYPYLSQAWFAALKWERSRK